MSATEPVGFFSKADKVARLPYGLALVRVMMRGLRMSPGRIAGFYGNGGAALTGLALIALWTVAFMAAFLPKGGWLPGMVVFGISSAVLVAVWVPYLIWGVVAGSRAVIGAVLDTGKNFARVVRKEAEQIAQRRQ